MAVLFFLRIEQQGENIAEQDCGGDACSRGGKSARKYAEDTFFVNGVYSACGEGVAKSGEGDGCAGSGKFHKWFVEPEKGQKNTQTNEQYKNSCWCEFGEIY